MDLSRRLMIPAKLDKIGENFKTDRLAFFRMKLSGKDMISPDG